MTSRLPLLATILVLGSVANAFPQEAPQPPSLNLPAGVRARVWSTTGTIRGFLLQSNATAIQVAPEPVGAVQTVPVASITRLELVLARKRNTLKGAVIGTLVLGAAGLGFSVDPNKCDDPSSTYFCSRGEAIAGGALAGAGLGALVGVFVKTDRFTPVDLGAFRQAPTPAARESRGPLSFGVTFRF